MPNNASADFRWLRTGEDALASMLAAIESAEQSVRLEMYIYTASPVGEQFRDTLVRAQQRGVRVRVLIDALGSIKLLASFWEPLIAAGGEFSWFNPLQLKRLLYRDHRKILVCDERLAFVGGYNIAPEYQGDGVAKGWRDLGLEVSGPLAQHLAAGFDAQFARADFQHRRFSYLRRSALRVGFTTLDGELFLSGPGRGVNPMHRALLSDLAQAKEIKIISAYFLPTRRFRRALMRRARQGAPVQLILAGQSDVLLSKLAGQYLYSRLLRSGIEIYEYQPQILHAKLFILDDIVYVGSANLDTRSLHINYELLIRLMKTHLADEARAIFAKDLKHSQRIHPAAWEASRTFWRKLKERWAYSILATVDPYLARRQ
jgi:cardiolipin synthase